MPSYKTVGKVCMVFSETCHNKTAMLPLYSVDILDKLSPFHSFFLYTFSSSALHSIPFSPFFFLFSQPNSSASKQSRKKLELKKNQNQFTKFMLTHAIFSIFSQKKNSIEFWCPAIHHYHHQLCLLMVMAKMMIMISFFPSFLWE